MSFKFCPQCGTEAQEADKFCRDCGFGDSCKECGNQSHEDDLFCRNCGVEDPLELDQFSEEITIDVSDYEEVERVSGGRLQSPASRENEVHYYDQHLVGESHYQEAIRKVVGRDLDDERGSFWKGMAHVSHEKKNKHDQWALVVKIRGETVGYLPAERRNKEIARKLAGKSYSVPARVVGGYLFNEDQQKSEGRKRAFFGVEIRTRN